jgi:hypothetical protein
MSSTQVFFAIVGVVSLEIVVVTTFLFHRFSRIDNQIKETIDKLGAAGSREV